MGIPDNGTIQWLIGTSKYTYIINSNFKQGDQIRWTNLALRHA